MTAVRARIAPYLFERLVKDLKRAPSSPVGVAGRVTLSDTRFDHGLVFRDVDFESDLLADAAEFTSLSFINCTFQRGLRIRNCHIRGDLSLADCRFPGTGVARGRRRLVMGGSRIDGNVELNDIVMDGICSLGRIKVGGDLLIADLRIRSSPKGVSLDLGRSDVKGTISLAPWGEDAKQAFSRPRSQTVVPGTLSAYSTRCHALELERVSIGQHCSLTGLQATGSIIFTHSSIGGDIQLTHVDCAEVFRIWRKCEVGGRLTFHSASVTAQLDISNSTIGDLLFNGASIGSVWIGASGPVRCREIFGTDSTFSSYVRMSRLTVQAQAPTRAQARRAVPRRKSADVGLVVFRHCHFKSQFTTWVAQYPSESRVDGWQDGALVTIEKGLSLTDCDVAGELNLTRLRVGGTCPAEAGSVRLDRTVVRGALHISSPLAVAQRLELPAEARGRARRLVRDKGAMAQAYRATMRALSAKDFQAGAVEITGLSLNACKLTDADSVIDGCLVGDRMKVTGRFATYVRETEDKDMCDDAERCRAHTEIEGAMRLRGATIGEFHLAGDSFQPPPDAPPPPAAEPPPDEPPPPDAPSPPAPVRRTAWTCGIVLELADIGLLRVARHEESRQGGANGFPVPLDLSGLQVRNWNFDEDIHAESPVTADHYLEFLDNDENLHREVYKSIAGSLRNAGRDEDAEKILYTEENRARWESRRPADGERQPWPAQRGRRPVPWLRLGRLFDGFDRLFLQYRRNTINLLYLIVALFLISAAFVSSHASNFELSDRSRLILQNESFGPTGYAAGIDVEPGAAHASEAHWGFWPAVWTAARYHVPIVSMSVQDEYVASNDTPLQVGLPWRGGSFLVRPAHAEDWFAIMSILNWIMWPLLLTFALRRALRAD